MDKHREKIASLRSELDEQAKMLHDAQSASEWEELANLYVSLNDDLEKEVEGYKNDIKRPECVIKEERYQET